MRILKTILVIFLGFILGVLSTLAAIVGGGYYIVNNVTPEQAEEMIQGFSPDFALPENFPENIMSMTIMEIISEVMDIAGSLDTLTLNQLQDRLGYQLPLQLEDGTDVSSLFAPIMDIPITTIPDNMDLVIDNISMNSLVSLGLLNEEDLPSLPIFSSPESMNAPLMSLFSDLDAFKISDVIDLYTGDYYPNENGNFVLVSCDWADYDENNPDHLNLTRYEEGYLADENGDFVREEDSYIAYDSELHAGRVRYRAEMLPSFSGDKVMANAVFESFDSNNPAHQSLRRFMVPEKSPVVLLAIGNAYINEVPESDPDGLTISQTINTLQVKDIMNVDGSSVILEALKDAYIGDSVPQGDPDGKTITDTVNALQIKQVIDIYPQDVYEGGVLIHPKSNQVLIAIQDSYIGNNPPEGGLTINETINTLQVKDIMEINPSNVYDAGGVLLKEKSTAILIAIQDAYIGSTAPAGEQTVSEIIDTLQVKNVINIYEGTEYVIDENGNTVINGFIAYDALNPVHLTLSRYAYDAESDTYYEDISGGFVPEFVPYDALLHDGFTRYSLAAKSSDILIAIADAYLGDNPPVGGLTISETVDTLTLSDIMEITDDSSQILKELKDTTINQLDSTLNTLKLKQTINIYTEDIFDAQGQIVQEKSNNVLINLSEAYIGAVPAEDPDGKTISETLDNLTVEQLIEIYDGTELIRDDAGIYYRIPVQYEPYDEFNPAHALLSRYRFSDTDGGYYPDSNGGFVASASEAFVENTDPLYTEFFNNNPGNPALPRYSFAEPSSTLINSLRLSSMDTIDTDINNLELNKLMTIDESSSRVLQSLQNTTLNNLDAEIQTFLLSDVIDIYDGYEYIADNNGDFVIDGYEPYDVGDPTHQYLTRYIFDGIDVYLPDDNGDWVENYIPYDAMLHDGMPRFAHPEASALILRSLKDAPINDMTPSINELQLKDVITVTPSSSKILQALQDVYIGDSAPLGEMTLDQKINVLTLGEAVDVYEEDTYFEDDNGGYVMDYIPYEPDNIEHATLQRYDDLYNPDSNGDYVYYYTPYTEPQHIGLQRYGLHPKSSIGLITLKDTGINELDSTIATLTLRDVLEIYDGYEFYESINEGTYIQDGYVIYDPNNPYQSHLTKYSFDGVDYVVDENGTFVPNMRLAFTPDEDDVFPRYALHAPSSKFIRSLADTPLNDMGNAMDTLTIGDMIEITPSSPKILQQFADSSLNNLEGTILGLQLKDVMEIYDVDIYEEDVNGYFVYNGVDYEIYDEFNPAHDLLTRYTRTRGIDTADNKVYEYDPAGDYVLDTFDTYAEDAGHLVLDKPRYSDTGILKSSNVVIALQDAYLYDEGTGSTLQVMLDNLTLVDMLGEPTPGSLLYAISYKDDDNNLATPDVAVKITEVESRTTEVMASATLQNLADWEIIDATGFNQDEWDHISTWSIQRFIEEAIVWMPIP